MNHRQRALATLADGRWYERKNLGIPPGSVKVIYALVSEDLIRCRKSDAGNFRGHPPWEFQIGPARTKAERENREHMTDCLEAVRARHNERCRLKREKMGVRLKPGPKAGPREVAVVEMSLEQHMALMYATAGRKLPRAAR